MNEIKLIETNGQTIAIVEVPEDAKSWDNEIFLIREDSYLRVWDTSGHDTLVDLPPGNWQILGKSTELSEEQMKEICEHYKLGYSNYKNPFSSDPAKAFTDSLEESYLSLLQANGIVDRNLIEKPEFNYEFGEDGPTDSQLLSAEIHFDESFKQWQETQSQVKTYLILIKK